MPKSAGEMVAEAKAAIENLTVDQVAAELKDGAVVVDLREAAERESAGSIPGAISAPRGMLEFHADPATKYHLAPLRPDRRVILYCAAGSRSALGARALKELGYANVAHLDGGVEAWRHEGRPLAAVGEVAR